jgi:hypothetical protein
MLADADALAVVLEQARPLPPAGEWLLRGGAPRGPGPQRGARRNELR